MNCKYKINSIKKYIFFITDTNTVFLLNPITLKVNFDFNFIRF